MIKINLQVKDENTKAVATEQFIVDEMVMGQVTNTIKVVNDVLNLVQNDENLSAVLNEFLYGTDEGNEDFSQTLTNRIVSGINVLLVEVPDKAIELLSAMSGIDYGIIMQQKADNVFDIYDAIIQVNDIDKLVQRAKKSFKLTKAQTKVMNMFKGNNQNKIEEVKKAQTQA